MKPTACPACDAAVEPQATGDGALWTCPSCEVRFLPPHADTATLYTSPSGIGGAQGEQVSGVIALPESFRARYELGRLLGVGGFGSVYQARELATGDTVAVKFLWRIGVEEVLARFLREGRLLSEIAHPHLIQVRHIEELAQHPYLVCEYVPGGSLKERLSREGKLAPDDAVRMVLDVLAALSECHARGIVHRDVKPANVLLTGSGRGKLADLGIARILEGDAGLTAHGAVLGTPAYMSPEQLLGEEVTPAADVYATAAMLYELIAGKPPYGETNVAMLLARIEAAGPPRLSERAPECPAELADVVHAGLARDPARRPGSAGVFADALRRWRRSVRGRDTVSSLALSGVLTSALSAPEAAAGRRCARLGAAVAGGAIALAMLSLWTRPPPAPRRGAPPGSVVTASPTPAPGAPDSANAPDSASARPPSVPVDEATRFALAPLPAWPPPAFHHRTEVTALAVTAGDLVSADRDGWIARWGADGASRGVSRPVTAPVLAAAPDFSAVAWRTPAGALRVAPPGRPDDGFTIPLAEEDRRYVAFSGDGKRVARATADGSLTIFETSKGLAIARLASATHVQAIALSRDGTALAVLLEGSQLVLRRESDGWRAHAAPDRGGEAVSLAPDGDTVATLTLARIELAGVTSAAPGAPVLGAARRVRVPGDYPAALAWAPDGKRLAAAGLKGVVMVDAATLIPAPLLWNAPDACRTLAWTDGRIAGGGARGSLAVWDADTRALLRERRRGSNRVSALAFGPDGARLAARTEDGDLAVMSFPAGRVEASFEATAGSALHVAGRHALLRSPRGATLFDLAARTSRPLGGDRWCTAALPEAGAALVGTAGEVTQLDPMSGATLKRALPRGLIGPACFLDADRAVLVPVSGKAFVHALSAGRRGAELDLAVGWSSEALDLDRRLIPAADGSRLLAIGSAFELIDTTTGAALARSPAPAGLRGVALSPRGQRLAVVTDAARDAREVGLRDAVSGALLATWSDAQAGAVARGRLSGAAAFAPDGRTLAVGTELGAVLVLELGGSAR